MTCSRTLQWRFVSGKHTPHILLLLSVAVWVFGTLLIPTPASIVFTVGPFIMKGQYFSLLLPPLCCVVVALMLGMLHLHERRIRWFVPMYLFLMAVSLFVHYDTIAAISLLFIAVAISQLFACQAAERPQGALFAAFASLGIFTLLLPQFIFVLPLFVVYMFIGNIFRIRIVLAAILGLIMPFWFLFGIIYVWPEMIGAVPSFDTFISSLAVLEIASVSPLSILLLVMELAVLLPAVVLFVRSSVPSKQHLRMRLSFVMIVNAYLILLSWLSEPNFVMFYVWRVPGNALMLSYLLSFKVTRISNIYFIVIIFLLLAIAALSLWAS